MPHNTGMDWIRLPKRMAIYHRDGFDCLWCQFLFPNRERTQEYLKGFKLTLDHVHPDGGNGAHNLVTCCQRCNSSRQDMPLAEWLTKLVERYGETQEAIAHRVLLALHKTLDLEAGKSLALARRPPKIIEPVAAE